jgi:hypothetical protein
MVLFPDPDGPTIAVVFPISNLALKSFKIFYSGLDGYTNVTFLNSIDPFKSIISASLSS